MKTVKNYNGQYLTRRLQIIVTNLLLKIEFITFYHMLYVFVEEAYEVKNKYSFFPEKKFHGNTWFVHKYTTLFVPKADFSVTFQFIFKDYKLERIFILMQDSKLQTF